MGDTTPVPPEPWGVISIKAQDEPEETPMQPITAMRNALGREEGTPTTLTLIGAATPRATKLELFYAVLTVRLSFRHEPETSQDH